MLVAITVHTTHSHTREETMELYGSITAEKAPQHGTNSTQPALSLHSQQIVRQQKVSHTVAWVMTARDARCQARWSGAQLQGATVCEARRCVWCWRVQSGRPYRTRWDGGRRLKARSDAGRDDARRDGLDTLAARAQGARHMERALR